MLHERVVSGFDLEILFGEPCLTALLRAVLAAALGPDSALDLASYGAVAPEDRFLHVRLSDIDLHGGELVARPEVVGTSFVVTLRLPGKAQGAGSGGQGAGDAPAAPDTAA